MFWHPGIVLTFCLDTKRFEKIKAVPRGLPENFGVANTKWKVVGFGAVVSGTYLPIGRHKGGCGVHKCMTRTLVVGCH